MGRFLISAGVSLLCVQAASAQGEASAAGARPDAGAILAARGGAAPASVSAQVPAASADASAARAAESVPAAAVAGQGSAAGAAAVAALVKKDPVNAYRDLLMATNELWFLLSGIRDKADADKAARRFGELVTKVSQMDDDLVLMGDEPQQQESLDQLRYQIMDAYCSVDSEFGGLCRVRCYGSQELVDAFQAAVAGGMFDADDLPLLEIHQPFTAEEARREIIRIRKLAVPDKALLNCLRLVTDSASAEKTAPELERLAEMLRGLLPESNLQHRNFHNTSAPAVRAVSEPVEALLWGIRSEIVRIVALPGYSDEPFDAFSDTLDKVYETLGETHSEWFDDVFDESFRIDLDEAYRENNQTATTVN